MSEERAIRTIVVAGGGIVGLSAALAFARALPKAEVTVIETAPDPLSLADAFPVSLASGPQFHSLIGLDEAGLVESGIATHFLGTLFQDWSASGDPWWHALGAYGKAAGAIPFDQIWVAAEAAGKARPFDQHSVAAALARAGKFIHPATDPNFIGSRFTYGLRLDPEPYRRRLRDLAQSAKVQFRSGELVGVDQADGRVEALQLGSDRVAADFFIDCTGPTASVARVLGDSFEDWSQWLPFGEMEMREGDGPALPEPADRVRADEQGWTAAWPLPGRTIAARFGKGRSLVRGRRLHPWSGNVLAIGDSSTAIDPLHRLNLDLAHNAILLALELLPGRAFDPVETGEYNRRVEQVTRRVRDFIALHYLRSGRSDGAWAGMATIEPPDSLARTLDQYEHRGRLPFHEEETISRDSWAAALIGLGVRPRHLDPQALNVPTEDAVAAMVRLVHEIDQAVAGVPTYGDYLGRVSR
jgi:tryptophan halogenase